MVEFMTRKGVNRYNLNDRFGDCEPSLVRYNYITPLAVCVETMVKDMWLEYKPKDLPAYIEDRQLAWFLDQEEFKKWLEEQCDIPKDLVKDVDKFIRKESNKFKHTLMMLPKRDIKEKRKSFICFYNFTAKYYKKRTGVDAPAWSETAFDELMNPEKETEYRKINQVYSNGGVQK